MNEITADVVKSVIRGRLSLNVIKIVFFITVLNFIVIKNTHAQAYFGGVQKGDKEKFEKIERQQKIKSLKKDPLLEKTVDTSAIESDKTMALPLSSSNARIQIDKILFSDSNFLSKEELSSVTTTYENKRLTFTDLSELINKINKLYQSKGVITARAVLPPQKISNGQINIQLVEAKLANIEITKNEFTDSDYILDRINAQTGEFIDIKTLEQNLISFNAINDIKLRANLQSGPTPGTSDYLFEVFEPKNSVLSLYIDNFGRDTTGKERASLAYNNQSLFGQRDQFYIVGVYAQGTESVYTSYNYPINVYGTRLGGSIDYSTFSIVDGELEKFNIAGGSTVLNLYVSHPLYSVGNSGWTTQLGVSAKTSETEFDGVDSFKNDHKTMIWGNDLHYISEDWMIFASPAVVVGVPSFGSEDSFGIFNVELNFIWTPDDKNKLLLKAGGQVSDTDQLPSSEQFLLGGSNSVRGFTEGYIVADNGYVLNAEYQTYSDYFSDLRISIFVDHGRGKTSAPIGAIDVNKKITSMGFGANYHWGQTISLDFIAAAPIFNKPLEADDFQIHAMFVYDIF